MITGLQPVPLPLRINDAWLCRVLNNELPRRGSVTMSIGLLHIGFSRFLIYHLTVGCSTGLEPAKTRPTIWRFDRLSHEHSRS